MRMLYLSALIVTIVRLPPLSCQLHYFLPSSAPQESLRSVVELGSMYPQIGRMKSLVRFTLSRRGGVQDDADAKTPSAR